LNCSGSGWLVSGRDVVGVLDEDPRGHAENGLPGAVEQHKGCDRQPADLRRSPWQAPDKQPEYRADETNTHQTAQVDDQPPGRLVMEAGVNVVGWVGVEQQ
jgi:hypothetical protein